MVLPRNRELSLRYFGGTYHFSFTGCSGLSAKPGAPSILDQHSNTLADQSKNNTKKMNSADVNRN
jgi:hypothetical protein